MGVNVREVPKRPKLESDELIEARFEFTKNFDSNRGKTNRVNCEYKFLTIIVVLVAFFILVIPSIIYINSYNSLKYEAIKAGVAKHVVDDKTGLSKFVFIKQIEKE